MDRKKNEETGIEIDELTYGSKKKVWFRCEEEGHLVKEVVRSVTGSGHGLNCWKCKSLKLKDPDLYKLLDVEKNEKSGIDIERLAYQANKKVWFRCEKEGHLLKRKLSTTLTKRTTTTCFLP